MRQRWPEKLWIVRHGQSAGNVARDAADAAGLAAIDLKIRDVDVPLSDLGQEQADALGRWFAALPEGERPDVVLASPYVRARQTAKAICEAGGVNAAARQPIVDERLREREFGIWDRLTTAGVRQKFPDQAEQRAGRLDRGRGRVDCRLGAGAPPCRPPTTTSLPTSPGSRSPASRR